MSKGETLEQVYRYNTVTEKMEIGTGTVREQSDGVNKFMILDGSAFKAA